MAMLPLTLLLLLLHTTLGSVQFVVEPQDLVVAPGADIWWHCRALNPFQQTNISYRWRFMSLVIREGPSHRLFNNGTFALSDVKNADFGVYQCMATDGDTVSFSRRATLSRAYLAPAFSRQPVSTLAQPGRPIQLHCDINSVPEALISWQHNNRPVTRGAVTVETRQRSVLTIQEMTQADVGEYRCRAVNLVLSDVRYSDVAGVNMEGRPRFAVAPSPVMVGVGSRAELECSGEGFPPPQAEWLDGRTPQLQTVIQAGGGEKYVVTNTSLTILDVHQTDAGFYSCRIYNSWGEESKTVLLTVLESAESPRFTSTPEDTVVMEGETVTWSCAATGRPDPIITWGKVDGVIPEDRTEIPYPGTLKLHDVGAADTGRYMCRAAGSGDVITYIWRLTVQVGPRFVAAPGDLAISRGETLSLPCSAIGTPSPDLAWKLPDGTEVPVPGSSKAQSVMAHSNGTLIISDVTQHDAGRYTCIARNIVTTRSASAAVYVYYGPQFTTSPSNTQIIEGEQATLHCAGAGFPLPTVTWYGPGSNQTLRTNEQVRLLANGSIVIYSVRREQEGRYTCVLDNGINQMIVSAQLSIMVRPYFRSEAVSVVVPEGANVWLHCVATGRPQPTLEWNQNDKLLVLEENMELNPNGTLAIRQITRAQFGNYVCLASNMAGKAEQISTVWRHDIPVITLPPYNTTANYSTTAMITCSATARSPPVITWYRSYDYTQPLEQGLPSDSYITEGTLVIQNVKAEDEGWYVCVATNKHGNASHPVYLDVKVLPVVDSSPLPVLAEEGSPVTLLCQSRGDPKPTISWQPPRSSDVINVTSSEFAVLGKTLVITSASVRRDAGTWRCEACNYLGCHHGYTTLNVQGGPVLVGVDTFLDGDITRLKCRAVGTPLATVIYYWGQLEVNPLSPPPGHDVIEGNWLEIEGKPQPPYTCVARNMYSRDSHTLKVPTPPTRIKIHNVTDTSVVLSWSLDVSTILQPSHVIIRLLIPSIIGRNAQSIVVSVSDDVMQTSVTSELVMSQVVGELQPYTQYSLQVAARNALGDSDNSPMVTTKTSEAAPTPPRDVRAVLDVTQGLVVTWKPPVRVNAKPAHLSYHIEYHNSRNEDTLTLVRNATQIQEVIFTGVKYGDTVNIQVTAVNSVRNLHSTPAHILLVLNEKPPSDAPRDVYVVPDRVESSIYVEWRAPHEDAGTVVGYMVALGQGHEFTVFRLDNAKTLNFKQSMLLQDVQYAVKVAAYNHGGVGPYSRVINVTISQTGATGGVAGGGSKGLGETELLGIIAGCVAVACIIILILLACCHYHKHKRTVLEKDIDAIYDQKELHLYDNKGFSTDTLVTTQSGGGRSFYDAVSINKDLTTPSSTPTIVTPVLSHHRHAHPKIGLAPDVVMVTERHAHGTHTSPSILRSNRLHAADFELAELTYGHSPMSSSHGKTYLPTCRASFTSEGDIYSELDLPHSGAINHIYADIHPSKSTGAQQLFRSRSLSRSRSSFGSRLGLLLEESTSDATTESPSGSDANEAVGGMPQPRPIYSVPTRGVGRHPKQVDYETKTRRMDFDSESSGEADTTTGRPPPPSTTTSRYPVSSDPARTYLIGHPYPAVLTSL